jgi:hypothetical protein
LKEQDSHLTKYKLPNRIGKSSYWICWSGHTQKLIFWFGEIK